MLDPSMFVPGLSCLPLTSVQIGGGFLLDSDLFCATGHRNSQIVSAHRKAVLHQEFFMTRVDTNSGSRTMPPMRSDLFLVVEDGTPASWGALRWYISNLQVIPQPQ